MFFIEKIVIFSLISANFKRSALSVSSVSLWEKSHTGTLSKTR